MERGRPAAGMLLFRRYAGEIQYLLLQKSSGAHHWSLPKGHVKKWEDPFMGAIRETFEDSGYLEKDLKIYTDITTTSEYIVKGKFKTVIYWLAELINPEMLLHLSSEHEDYKWLPREEAKDLAHYEELSNVIDWAEEQILKLQK
ncbi:unnamed protein product [Hermetia illucens]|uniref:Bis(5'-nucleosyl)-tetraphosphatase [asymmetrical] n=1 Tax=Hermetia illucens TaxID=343691 RepID=A0A7R8YNX7_HERIL|nr:bis(5'-nucleosyl)-tetraphosphatase [asymmetrical]-like [Hermetia illucens]CAD7078915.1 unnamed protein product [Hermetia illucens]